MRTVRINKQLLFLFIPLLGVIFLLAACGSNTNSGSNPPTGATATPTSGSFKNNPATANGCPGSDVISNAPTAASIILKQTDNNTTINAKNGDLIEVRLPYGISWTGPTVSQGVLELQTPSGYAYQPDKVCVWRFVAKGSGTTQLQFTGKPICRPSEACPQYILGVFYTIEAK